MDAIFRCGTCEKVTRFTGLEEGYDYKAACLTCHCSKQPERSKREEPCKCYSLSCWVVKCPAVHDKDHKHVMRCSEHGGNLVREAL